MPGAIFSRHRFMGAGAERNALRIATAVGVDARIKSLRDAVVGRSLVLTVDTQHFAADPGRALWHFAVVGALRRSTQDDAADNAAPCLNYWQPSVSNIHLADRSLHYLHSINVSDRNQKIPL
jgi:hypothetical protein